MYRTGCEFCRSFEPLEVMGEKQTQAGSVHQERTGQKTRRSGAFRPHTLPRKPTIFLTAPLSHAAMAIHLGPCETLRRYRELATSSIRRVVMWIHSTRFPEWGKYPQAGGT